MAFSTRDFPNLVFESFEQYRNHLKLRERLLNPVERGSVEAIFIRVDKEEGEDADSTIETGKRPHKRRVNIKSDR